MKYPSRSEYCSFIRNPKIAFRKKDPRTKIEYDLDSSLVNGQSVEKTKFDGTKELWSASGSFAIAFKYKTFSPQQIWAVRCFYRSNFNVKEHYQNALIYLRKSYCRSYFVNFSFLEEGIRVLGKCYPILKMEWIEGENIKKFIKDNLNNQNKLNYLAKLWIQLSHDLLEAGIAHGDLQYGNILIVDNYNQLGIKLIDYDSLFFSIAPRAVKDNIKGLPDYQHPLRKSLENRCLEIDFFPQLVIYLSILALAEDKSLWKTYSLDETEGLLFSSTDFQNPDQANIFQSLAKLPSPIPELANKLKQICKLEYFKSIPSLDIVLSNQNISTNYHIQTNHQISSSNHNRIWNLIPTLNLERNTPNQKKIKNTKLKTKIDSQIVKTKPIKTTPQKSNNSNNKSHNNSSQQSSVAWDPRSYKARYRPNQNQQDSNNYNHSNGKGEPNILKKIFRSLFS